MVRKDDDKIIKQLKEILTTGVKEYTEKANVQTEWREPLIAIASAQDELFYQLKSVISPEHNLPKDLVPEAKSVICYFLPFAAPIPTSNAVDTMKPAMINIEEQNFTAEKKRKLDNNKSANIPENLRPTTSWAKAYKETNDLIGILNKKLKSTLQDLGGRANYAAATGNFSPAELISYWSHKHAAYIAGLGTFGLHQMLITRAGSAGRIGSLVTDLKLPVTERPEQEYCLAKAGKDCQQCIDSCHFKALTADNRLNKEKCYEILQANARYFADDSLEICGKCVSGVPCSI